MKRRELVEATTPDSLVEHVKQAATTIREAGHGHHGTMESVREATYRGHDIVIRTSYQIEVDGTPITGHMGVTNDGQVHYHAVPNLSFASAVDLVKQLIDTFPADFQSADSPEDGHHHDHADGHQHGQES